MGVLRRGQRSGRRRCKARAAKRALTMRDVSGDASSSQDITVPSVVAPGSIAVCMVSTGIQPSMPELADDLNTDFDSGDMELLEVLSREWADITLISASDEPSNYVPETHVPAQPSEVCSYDVGTSTEPVSTCDAGTIAMVVVEDSVTQTEDVTRRSAAVQTVAGELGYVAAPPGHLSVEDVVEMVLQHPGADLSTLMEQLRQDNNRMSLEDLSLLRGYVMTALLAIQRTSTALVNLLGPSIPEQERRRRFVGASDLLIRHANTDIDQRDITAVRPLPQ